MATTETVVRPAGVVRRLGAMIYDALLVTAVLMLATVPFVPFLHGKVLVPQEVGGLAYVYRAWLLAVSVLFFGFFWTRRGQTVGMQAWRLRLEDEHGALLTWPTALRRLSLSALPWMPSLMVFAIAEQVQSLELRRVGWGLLALGLISLASLWLNPQQRTWYDRLTRSRVVVRPKR